MATKAEIYYAQLQAHWKREAERKALIAEREAAGVCLDCGGKGWFKDSMGTGMEYTRLCAFRDHAPTHPEWK